MTTTTNQHDNQPHTIITHSCTSSNLLEQRKEQRICESSRGTLLPSALSLRLFVEQLPKLNGQLVRFRDGLSLSGGIGTRGGGRGRDRIDLHPRSESLGGRLKIRDLCGKRTRFWAPKKVPAR